MKIKFILLIILSILIIQVFTQINPYIFKGNKISYNSQKNKIRNTEYNNNFEPIRIYTDFTYIKSQANKNSNLVEVEKLIENSIENSINILKKLINVHPLSYSINKITQDDLNQWNFTSNNIDNSLLTNGAGINSDLVILLKFIEDGEENLLIDNEIASISNKFILDEGTNGINGTYRPIIGVIYISNNINITIGNIDIYLKSIFLHQLTHILGFHYDLFKYYPGGLDKTIKTEKEERTKLEKKFIKTKTVVEFAKKYFNCNTIDGVELENQNKFNHSHWEARILLGEYMTSSPYTPEQAISEFTLALLKDSGWYEVNYYTGGLMRFGKNRGCDFLKKDCANDKLESNFKFEFCDFYKGNQPTCSSGRQSRTYCKSYTPLQIDINFSKYMRFKNYYGRKDADYCPVNDIEIEEEKEIYYVGNCKYGNGKYGTHNNFGENAFNEKFEKILGEIYGPNSFCALSTILPEEELNKSNFNGNEIHSVCYPMFCSSKSLTIQIYDQFIVCPREGGKVEVNGKYKGYIICPDYNLICTGTKFCNDMFDCVEKESLAKEDTFKYNYTINYDDEKIFKAEEIAELGDDGLCPKNCGKCGDDKKCLKWLDGYENSYSDKETYKEESNEWKIEEIILNDINNVNIDEIIKTFIDKNNNNNEKLIVNYKNENSSIIIYKGKGNKEILESISSENEKKIVNILNDNYANDNNKIKVILNQNGTHYIGVYDEKGNKLNIKDECPDCSNIKLNIKNNYENNLKNRLGEPIKNAILINKINIFDEESPIFNDICSNFTISGIDIPLDSRKDLFYLGDEKNEIICGNSECDIIKDNYNSNNLEGECKCNINLNLDNISLNNNNYKNKKEKKEEEISNSETVKNSFEIFKCFKNTQFLKANEGFYISICTLGVQSICFAFYIISATKMPIFPAFSIANPISKKGKKDSMNNNSIKSEESGDIINGKDEGETNQQTNNLVKIDSNIINYGNIDEEILDDDKYSNNNNKNKEIANTNFHCREANEIKLDTITIENKANFKLNRELSRKSINEDTKSLDEKDELNDNNVYNKKKDNNLNTDNNVNTNANIYVTTTNGDNKPKETIDNLSLHGSVNKKLNFKEKEIKDFDEEINNKKVLILFNNKNKKKKIKNEKNEKNKEIPLDYLPLGKAIEYDKRSFGIIYWCIFSFKQPIVNIFSFLEVFHITRSCIPIQMKLIRFLLMIIINIFINSMTITQNYFKKKYEYFNKKYEIEESENIKLKIDPLERLSYAMKHCFPEVIITFIICMIAQFIINFIFFGIRRELCLIAINEKKENMNKEVQKLIKKTKIRYIIFSFINLVFMIIFFVYLTNFTTAYSGGALDYIGAGIWTFIFLQILPFISSLIITFLRYYGIKKNKEGMYKISQVLLA